MNAATLIKSLADWLPGALTPAGHTGAPVAPRVDITDYEHVLETLRAGGPATGHWRVVLWAEGGEPPNREAPARRMGLQKLQIRAVVMCARGAGINPGDRAVTAPNSLTARKDAVWACMMGAVFVRQDGADLVVCPDVLNEGGQQPHLSDEGEGPLDFDGQPEGVLAWQLRFSAIISRPVPGAALPVPVTDI